jgi:AcrR family transcriptional regulator
MPKMKISDTAHPIIFAAAVFLAKRRGLFKFSRVDIAREANVAESTVSHHFGTMQGLRVAIVKHAVKNEILSILADARASREPLGVSMPEELKKKIAAHITQ